MANSKYEYVRAFEQPDSLLANTWIVVRIDGRAFSKLTAKYQFVKPNDRNALDLMNAAAQAVMKDLPDLVLAYGNSDEYSFVFHKACALFERRASKLTTTIVSTFTSYYVFLWPEYFADKPLTPPLPSFDGRAVCYPSDLNLRDYMSWRQVDCHINNLYNTTFWTLVQKGGLGAREAEQRLSGTVSSHKNEILFNEFGINYNNEPECFKKGTVLYRDFFPPESVTPSPDLAIFPLPPIASPQPRRPASRPVSQPLERAISQAQNQIVEQGPGPTFLSTTSTPSPPSSPATMMKTGYPNPLRSNPVSPRHSTNIPPTSVPLSPPSTNPSPYGSIASSYGKQGLPLLAPLPLSPPTLKPSTKPPISLNPPNPTTRANFSPMSPPRDFPTDFPIAGYSHRFPTTWSRPTSHSASASIDTTGPPRERDPELKQRSPSQPHLPTYFASGNYPPGGPPVIPLRMSSIPTNNQPRKLSLRNQRSLSNVKPISNGFEEKENIIFPAQASRSSTPRRLSPPSRKNKSLPNPPTDTEEEMYARGRNTKSDPQPNWSMFSTSSTQEPSSRRISDPEKRGGHVWKYDDVAHPTIAELPAIPSSSRRAKSHSRLFATPVDNSLNYVYEGPHVENVSSSRTAPKSQSFLSTFPIPDDQASSPITLPIQLASPLKGSLHHGVMGEQDRSMTTPPKADNPLRNKDIAQRDSRHKGKAVDQGVRAADTTQLSTDGRPVHMSRTQKDKDRKKRSKAKILVEHVDIIKDDFWEKRPWILSGRTG